MLYTIEITQSTANSRIIFGLSDLPNNRCRRADPLSNAQCTIPVTSATHRERWPCDVLVASLFEPYCPCGVLVMSLLYALVVLVRLSCVLSAERDIYL